MAVKYCINTCSLSMKTVINSTCIESHVLISYKVNKTNNWSYKLCTMIIKPSVTCGIFYQNVYYA